MAFEVVGTPSARNASPGVGTADNITVSSTTTGNKEGRHALSIRIGANVLHRLGWVPRQHRVLLMEGTMREAGLVKIVLAPANHRPSYALSSNGLDEKTGNIKVSVTAFQHHSPPQACQPQTVVEFQAFGGDLLIMLPAWAPPRQGAA